MPARTIELKCETLTPLWTGGADRGIDRVHETGLLGSMRWWFEALLRGAGARACDPTAHTCLYKPETDSGICEACRVFGTTGWRRRFRLTVIDDEQLRDQPVGDIVSSRGAKWFFDGSQGVANNPALKTDKPKVGPFTLRLDDLDSRAGADHFDLQVIAGLLQFMADWAGIGARNQMGFGRFRILGERQDTRPLYDYLVARHDTENDLPLPSLKDFFFAVAHSRTNDKREAFDLKADLRALFITPGNPQRDRAMRHYIMGIAAKDEDMAAKVKMSWPIDRELRVWGWLPSMPDRYRPNWSREAVGDAIRDELRANWQLSQWHEVDTPRNTHLDEHAGMRELLRYLLRLEDQP